MGATTMASSLWEYALNKYDPYVIKFVGLIVTNVVFWWLPCAVFLSLDYIAPSFARRHKMQPKAKNATRQEVLICISVVVQNHLLALVEYTALSYVFSTRAYPTGIRFNARLPSMGEFLREFLLSFFLREVMFYYGHRAFHWRPLYKHYHEIHHKFTAPIAFASQYAHPFEYLTSDSLPVMLPPLLLRTHVVTMWVFTAGVFFTSTVIHSGYDFFYHAARMHDRHHEGANAYFGAFGALGFLDWAHGTVEKNNKAKSR